MSYDPKRLEAVRRVSRAHARDLLGKANVVGVGVGSTQSGDLTLVVMVTHKLPRHQLAAADLVPQEIEGIPVELRVVGELKAGVTGRQQAGASAKGEEDETD